MTANKQCNAATAAAAASIIISFISIVSSFTTPTTLPKSLPSSWGVTRSISSNNNSVRNHGTFLRSSTLSSAGERTPVAEFPDSEFDTTIPEDWTEDVLMVLSLVVDPDLNDDIVSLGFIKELTLDRDARRVSFHVELTTPACPIKESFREQCEELVLALPWTLAADVTMTSREPPPPIPVSERERSNDTPYGMSAIAHVIAVSSCKGGVGKSTTAVNLAYALSGLGARVGIFDADVYGPSLPTMVEPDNDDVNFVGRQISPLEREGVKLMSFGYVNDGAAIMRGPMVTQLLDQFLSLTYWGPLDYLILDMPPGTGDIQLTLSQKLNITAAVIVTTPQELSFADVVRGVDMFQEVNVPCVAVVENMAYLDLSDQNLKTQEQQNIDMNTLKKSFVSKIEQTMSPLDPTAVNSLADELVALVQQEQQQNKQNNNDDDDDSNQLRIFGAGHRERLQKQWGIEHAFSVPLMQNIAHTGDSGTPFILQQPDSIQAQIYRDLASSVVQEVAKIEHSGSSNIPRVVYDRPSHAIVVEVTTSPSTSRGASPDDDKAAPPKTVAHKIRPAELRRDCKCASCVEELTGRQLLLPQAVPETIWPVDMAPCGNYALSVDWSDGHKSLYPYKQLRAILEEQGEVVVDGILPPVAPSQEANVVGSRSTTEAVPKLDDNCGPGCGCGST